MTTAPIAASRSVDGLRSAGEELQRYLLRMKRQIDDDIRTYPTPIPRCDAQFNHLYEQRSRLAQAVALMNAALADDGSPQHVTHCIAQFTTGAPYSDGDEERQLRFRLANELLAFEARR